MRISVVVPVRNEQDSIRELLDSLLSQTQRPEEIIITDGGSTDATTEIIESYVKRGAPIRLVYAGPALPGRGRNLAAAIASSEWLAFTDGGVRPAPDWIGALARRAEQDPSVEVVYGAWRPITDSFFKECAAIAYVPAPIERDGVLIRPRFIASSLIRLDVWRGVGGFPEHLRSAEDILFMNKVEEAGFRTVYEPGALVDWNIQPTLWHTFKRFVTYSRNNIRAGLWRKWQAAIFRRYALIGMVAVPAIFVGVKWLILPLLLWLALLVARAVRALRQNRHSYPAGIVRNTLRLLLIVPIIATLDLAAFIGSINWLLADKLHLAGAQRNNDPQ